MGFWLNLPKNIPDGGGAFLNADDAKHPTWNELMWVQSELFCPLGGGRLRDQDRPPSGCHSLEGHPSCGSGSMWMVSPLCLVAPSPFHSRAPRLLVPRPRASSGVYLELPTSSVAFIFSASYSSFFPYLSNQKVHTHPSTPPLTFTMAQERAP